MAERVRASCTTRTPRDHEVTHIRAYEAETSSGNRIEGVGDVGCLHWPGLVDRINGRIEGKTVLDTIVIILER